MTTTISNKHTISNEQDCADFINGCLFMGTGGGGDPQEGSAALAHALNDGITIGWVDPGDVDDEALTATAYASGSIAPRSAETGALIASLALGEPTGFDVSLAVAIELLADYLGESIQYLVPVELGASNTPGPLIAGARMGIPVVDGDYSGRAVPDEMQGTPFIHGIASHPFTSVDAWGNSAIVTNTANPFMLERVSKMLSVAGIDGTSIASTPLVGRTMKEIIVPGTLSKCLAIGRAISGARNAGGDPVTAALDVVGGWRLFDGEVVDKKWEDRDGYMFGTVDIAGRGVHSGSELRIWFKNENHVTWLNGEPWVCSPDLVTMVSPDSGVGYTTTAITVGDQVSVVGMAGLEVFRAPDAIQRAFGPQYFGFDQIDYRPIEQLV